MTWTRFMDMHSGGGQKEEWSKIYIEAPEEEAKVIFYNKFGHSPDRVTCTCCGEDYSTDEGESLARVSAFDRGLRWVSDKRDHYYLTEKPSDYLEGRYLEPHESIPDGMEQTSYGTDDVGITVEELVGGAPIRGLLSRGDRALFVTEAEILPEWRSGSVPAQGYVWVG